MLQLPKLSVSVHTEKTLHNLYLFARVPLLNYQIFKPLSTVQLISRNMFNVSRVVQEFFKMRWLNCVGRGWPKKNCLTSYVSWNLITFKNSSERKYWKLSAVTESFKISQNFTLNFCDLNLEFPSELCFGYLLQKLNKTLFWNLCSRFLSVTLMCTMAPGTKERPSVFCFLPAWFATERILNKLT